MSDRDRSPSGEPGSEEEIPPVANYPQQEKNIHSTVNFCPGLVHEERAKQLQQDTYHSLEKDVPEAMSLKLELGQWCQLQQRVSALEQKEKEHQQAVELLRQQLAENQRQQKIESQEHKLDVKMDMQEQKLARLEEQLKETREQVHELGVQQQLQSQAQKVQHQKLESLTQLERQPLGLRNQQSGITQALAARKFEHLPTKDGADKENYTPQKMPM